MTGSFRGLFETLFIWLGRAPVLIVVEFTFDSQITDSFTFDSQITDSFTFDSLAC